MATWDKALKGIGAYKAYKTVSDWPTDFQEYLLDRMGLEHKSTTATILSGVGFFALGCVVGGALGMIFAPMSGTEMRSTMREQGFKGVVDRSRPMASSIPTA